MIKNILDTVRGKLGSKKAVLDDITLQMCQVSEWYTKFTKHKLPNVSLLDFLEGKIDASTFELTQAEEYFEAVQKYCPDAPRINFALANIASGLGEYSRAENLFIKQVEHTPDEGKLWLNLGVVQLRSHSFMKAKRSLMRAMELMEGDPLPQIKLAHVYFKERNYELVEQTLKVIKGYENEREAMELLVSVHVAREEYDIALACLDSMVKHYKDDPRLYAHYGYIYHMMEAYPDSLAQYRRALDLDPKFTDAITNLGILYRDMGSYELSRACFENTLRIDNQHVGAQWGLSLCMLLNGEYETGWPYYETRVYRSDYSVRYFDLLPWRGEEIENSKLLVTAEQGLGDEIMFASCVPDLINTKKSVILECNPKLEQLYARSFPELSVVGREPTLKNDWVKEISGLKYSVSVGSLPNIFRRNKESFPKHNGYLHASNDKVLKWRSRLSSLGDRPKIGISWRGGIKNTRSNARSIPLGLWEDVVSQPYDFISLQYGDCVEEISQFTEKTGLKIHHWHDAIRDYDETAALVKAVDLVVSVQTALVHLSGAIGQNTLALISAAPEWRYGKTGESMPWYPSVRLIRQTELLNWGSIMVELCDVIEEYFY